MGLSYDSASSILLCAEDNNSILCFENEFEEREEVHGWEFNQERSDIYGDIMNSFPIQTEECLELMVKKEAEHLPRDDYEKRLVSGALVVSVRRDAIDWIWKVHAHYNFGPFCAYLSINYLDRFLSEYEIPQGKAWMTQLLSVACLSLAAKVEETEVPLCLDLQAVDAKYVFEAKTIRRMELLVLSTLKWRMQALTPFSFVDYFLHKFNDGIVPTKSLISRSTQLILSTIRGIEFLRFKPSEIASAVAMSVLGEIQDVNIEKTVTCSKHVNKERVLRCYEDVQEVILMRSGTKKDAITPQVSDAPQSPNGVLDVSCMSYKSDDTTNIISSHDNSQHNSPPSKRRKLNKPCMS